MDKQGHSKSPDASLGGYERSILPFAFMKPFAEALDVATSSTQIRLIANTWRSGDQLNIFITKYILSVSMRQ